MRRFCLSSLIIGTTLISQISAFSIKYEVKRSCLIANQSIRRDIFTAVLSSVVLATTVVGSPKSAFADVDFSTIQDLLGAQESQTYVPGGKRPMYLTEPTEDFKINEQKSLEFKRKNLQIKKTFVEALDKISTDPDDVDVLASDLDSVRLLVTSNSGLPEGVSKEEVVKICRRRKSKKFWPTDVEIA
jgi:hypothetical protein